MNNCSPFIKNRDIQLCNAYIQFISIEWHFLNFKIYTVRYIFNVFSFKIKKKNIANLKNYQTLPKMYDIFMKKTTSENDDFYF